jgi:hypothetical protein
MTTETKPKMLAELTRIQNVFRDSTVRGVSLFVSECIDATLDTRQRKGRKGAVEHHEEIMRLVKKHVKVDVPPEFHCCVACYVWRMVS